MIMSVDKHTFVGVQSISVNPKFTKKRKKNHSPKGS